MRQVTFLTFSHSSSFGREQRAKAKQNRPPNANMIKPFANNLSVVHLVQLIVQRIDGTNQTMLIGGQQMSGSASGEGGLRGHEP